MSANFRNGYMRRLRKYTADVEALLPDRQKAIAGLEKFKGSPFYNEQMEVIEKKFADKRAELLKTAVADVQKTLDTMRNTLKERITKAPDQQMTATLQIMSMLKNISPSDIRLYEWALADCPLAMKVLRQIAEPYNIRIDVLDTDEAMEKIDYLEGIAATYLQNFIGGLPGDVNKIAENSSASIMDFMRYFRPENEYENAPRGDKNSWGSSEKVDRAFLKKFLGWDSPDVFEDGYAAAPKVQYIYSDLDGVLEHISALTEGIDKNSPLREKLINDFLADCPDHYGAAYRNYLSTGEKGPLNDEFGAVIDNHA